MPKTQKRGKDALQSIEDVYYQTFQKLCRQRERVDRQILKVQGKILRFLTNKSDGRGRKSYVSRMHNTIILRDAIRGCMVLGKKMTMGDIMSSLQKGGSYHTNSKYFYTMVNNKLNRDKRIRKNSRGVFVLQASKSGRKGHSKKPVSTAV